MANAIKDRLNWLYRNYSEREISRQTGIPRATLYRWKTTGADPTKRWNTNIVQAYNRGAYKAIRMAGYPTRTAVRVYKVSPATLDARVAKLEKFIDVLTAQNIKRKQELALEKGKPFDYPAEFAKMREAVWRGFRKSQKGINDWINYKADARKILLG